MVITSTKTLISEATSIWQGAEAKIYKTVLHTPEGGGNGEPVLLKHRFTKTYRHPTLDSSLTKARVAGEARALIRCLRSGVSVPGIRLVDAVEGVLGIEWIEGKSVRFLLGGGAEGEEEETGIEASSVPEAEDDVDSLEEYEMTRDRLTQLIGTEIAKMHLAEIIHGDLTTSNMMVRHPSHRGGKNEFVLIDFGLSQTSTLTEDKAVDLYVLERAFASTHPQSEALFQGILDAYAAKLGPSRWRPIEKRLEEVRLRGRKRSMVG